MLAVRLQLSANKRNFLSVRNSIRWDCLVCDVALYVTKLDNVFLELNVVLPQNSLLSIRRAEGLLTLKQNTIFYQYSCLPFYFLFYFIYFFVCLFPCLRFRKASLIHSRQLFDKQPCSYYNLYYHYKLEYRLHIKSLNNERTKVDLWAS